MKAQEAIKLRNDKGSSETNVFETPEGKQGEHALCCPHLQVAEVVLEFSSVFSQL